MSNQETTLETWKQIWTRKGLADSSVTDLLAYDGYEATKVDMEEVARQIAKRLDIQKNDKVLEVGCGAGALAQYLDCDYVGIDYSPTLVRKHIEILHNSVLTGEAADLPFKDKSFDKVICYGVYLYFDNKEYADKATKELLRVAKKGVLIGEIPMRSHRTEHLLFNKEDFQGWDISDGFYDPYRKDRFNAVYLFS
ncbi:class I SAM-dependent methyltransferase [Lacrimispora sp.]|uniref:class I SAM-dependent methyltransferase n=1 Tax=Lacrimispora sp. TaxID=2719234 RepID=UPI002FD9CE3E